MTTLLTVAEVAARLRVTEAWLRCLCRRGEIEHVRLGPSRRAPIRFHESAVDDYLAACEQRAHQPRRRMRIATGGRR